jgi:S1-C subfamily serine protease
MRYTAVTRRGMSGGPVFDVSGRVVGVHGQGDREGVVKNEAGSGAGTIDLKTGLNAAIPINTFVSIAPQAKVEKTALAIDTAKVADAPATTVSKQEVRSWEEEFALSVGIGLVLRGLNVPASIPIPGFGGFRF